MTDSPDDRGIRELCEKHGFAFADGHAQPLAVALVREAIQGMREKAARAIEHGGYLADAVDHYLEERNKFDALEQADVGDQDSLNDHFRALRDCSYEFRKRVRALVFTEEDARLSTKL